MTLLLSFAALLPRLLLGFDIVHLIWKPTDGKSLLIKIFLSAGVGFGISSLLSFIWIWVGLPLAIYAMLESAIAVALTIWMFYKNRITLRLATPFERSDQIWGLILAVSVIVFVLELAFYSLQFPHGRPDAWINWNVVARFIYLGGTDWQATFLRQLDHPDYPLFMAMTNAITWVFLGEPSTWGPIAFHFTLSLFTVGLLFAFINLLSDFKQASLAVVLFMALPFIVDQGMRQYADLLLAYLILGAGGLTLIYLQTKELNVAVLVGLMVGLGGWAKNEGLSAILVFSLIWVWISLKKEDRPGMQKYLVGLAFPLVVIALFKTFLAPANDLLSASGSAVDKLMDAERYLTIAREVGTLLWNVAGTPIPLFGLIILVVLSLGRSAKQVPGLSKIAVVVGLQWLLYLGIYLMTPLDLTYHIKTSADRLLLHVLPLAALWLFLWLRSPQVLFSKES
ncbi:MAG: hypothetical protein J0L96_03600 [Anaerolineae bacterium]|nr:hypothetical protein [Anaerolineae bacterium]